MSNIVPFMPRSRPHSQSIRALGRFSERRVKSGKVNANRADSQINSPHMQSLGAVDVPRDEYLEKLADAITMDVSWGEVV